MTRRSAPERSVVEGEEVDATPHESDAENRVFLWACGGLFVVCVLGLVLVPFADWNAIASTLSLLLSALGVVLAIVASGRRVGIPRVVAAAVALAVPIVVGVVLLRPDVDITAFCRAKNKFDLHSSDVLEEIATGTVERRTIILLRNDVRAAEDVAPTDLRPDLDVIGDAYDRVAAGLGNDTSLNAILIGTALANEEVAAATNRVAAVEDELCT